MPVPVPVCDGAIDAHLSTLAPAQAGHTWLVEWDSVKYLSPFKNSVDLNSHMSSFLH